MFDDSVIKLTIKQGLESERFPVTEISESGTFIYNGETKTITDYNDINSISGALTTGELGYTRDTNRLFIGNISEELEGSQQQTLGGVLSGNKYLGYVDSRSGDASNNSENNAIPIDLGELLSGSSYRTYNFSGEKTKDGKWPRFPHYNMNYDAYDGDYMYDIYRNALILFDHNIKPLYNSNGEVNTSEPDGTNFKLNKKRKTPLIPRFHKETSLSAEQKPVYNFTKDMYGDGYVLFYNVIPDGETLTFENKGFNSSNESHNPDNTDNTDNNTNYSYNIIKINKVPSSAIIESLDKNYFEISGNLISLAEVFKKQLADVASVTYTDDSISSLIVNDGEELVQSDISAQAVKNITNGFDSTSFAEGVIAIAKKEEYVTKGYVDDAIKNLPRKQRTGRYINYWFPR